MLHFLKDWWKFIQIHQYDTMALKTHIHKWVCGTETIISSPIPVFILLHYITESWLSGSNVQAHNWKIWTVASDPKLSFLARWTHSIRTQQDGAWKGIGGVIIEMLVYMPQTRSWQCIVEPHYKEVGYKETLFNKVILLVPALYISLYFTSIWETW